MSKSFVVIVPQEFVNYVERLSYEESSLRNIIITYLDMHKSDTDDTAINNPIFQSYQKKYMDASTAYEIAKSKITKDFVPECLSNHQVNWNLDFNTNELTITVNCDCGIEVLDEYLLSKSEIKVDNNCENCTKDVKNNED